MELRGVIEALKWARRFVPEHRVLIITDSKYIDKIPEWAVRWRANGWKTAKKQDVKNKDLVLAYLIETEKANGFASEHVHGHSGDVWNEHADLLVNIAMDEMIPLEDIRDEYQYGESNE
jgi:ribonuclease HI